MILEVGDIVKMVPKWSDPEVYTITRVEGNSAYFNITRDDEFSVSREVKNSLGSDKKYVEAKLFDYEKKSYIVMKCGEYEDTVGLKEWEGLKRFQRIKESAGKIFNRSFSFYSDWTHEEMHTLMMNIDFIALQGSKPVWFTSRNKEDA